MNHSSMKPGARKTRKEPAHDSQATAKKPAVQEMQSPKVTNQPESAKATTQPKVGNQAPVTNAPKVPSNRPSPAQVRAIENLAKRRGIDADKLEEMSQHQFGTAFTNLTAQEASTFIRTLQQSA